VLYIISKALTFILYLKCTLPRIKIVKGIHKNIIVSTRGLSFAPRRAHKLVLYWPQLKCTRNGTEREVSSCSRSRLVPHLGCFVRLITETDLVTVCRIYANKFTLYFGLIVK
jgi:hypothetical protein